MVSQFYIQLILICLVIFAKGQTADSCLEIVKEPETMAIYKKGSPDIIDFFKKNVSNCIDSCYKNESRMISNLEMFLTIDRNGKVVAAYVKSPILPTSCRKSIQQAFLRMDPWTAAQDKGQKVCSNVIFPIHIDWR
jgi:hypothetical protein